MCSRCNTSDVIKDISTLNIQLKTVNHLCRVFATTLASFFQPFWQKFSPTGELDAFVPFMNEAWSKLDAMDTPWEFDLPEDPESPEDWQVEEVVATSHALRRCLQNLVLLIRTDPLYKAVSDANQDRLDLLNQVQGTHALALQVLERLYAAHSTKSSPADLPSPSQN